MHLLLILNRLKGSLLPDSIVCLVIFEPVIPEVSRQTRLNATEQSTRGNGLKQYEGN